MTFDELQQKINTQNPSDWRQHSNGGGWLFKTAEVDSTAYVGKNAIVWGMVSGNARVYGNAQVSGDARVYPDRLLL